MNCVVDPFKISVRKTIPPVKNTNCNSKTYKSCYKTVEGKQKTSKYVNNARRFDPNPGNMK